MYYSTNLSNSSRKHSYLLIPWKSQFYSYYTLHEQHWFWRHNNQLFTLQPLFSEQCTDIFWRHSHALLLKNNQHWPILSPIHGELSICATCCIVFLSGQNYPPNPWVKNWWIRKQYSHILIAQASFNRRVSCRIHMCRCHCYHYSFDYHQKWYCNWSPWEPREIILITFTMIQCL